MFHKQRLKMEAVEEQYRLKALRHAQYDQFLFLVFRYWSSKIVELLFESKRRFHEVFCADPASARFEISICFLDGKLNSDPTMDEHISTFKKVFEEMEKAVKNQSL